MIGVFLVAAFISPSNGLSEGKKLAENEFLVQYYKRTIQGTLFDENYDGTKRCNEILWAILGAFLKSFTLIYFTRGIQYEMQEGKHKFKGLNYSHFIMIFLIG